MKNMKSILALMLVATSSAAFAADAKVYCKVGNETINVLADNGYECVSALLTIDTDEACFTGTRAGAIEILNGLQAGGLFDGTDGEYVKNAKFKGRTEIAYTVVDDANEVEMKSSMKRCTSAFFAN